MGKPVIYYRFDVEQYCKNRGSYLDLDQELIGEICHTEDELVHLLGNYMRTDYMIPDKIKQNNFLTIPKNAEDICGRIVDEVQALES